MTFGDMVFYIKKRACKYVDCQWKIPSPPLEGFETYIILKYNILAIQNQPAIQNNPRFRGVVALGS